MTLRVTKSRVRSRSQLREALTTRVEKEHSAWLDEIGTALDEARIIPRFG